MSDMISDKLAYLAQTKGLIREAIESKGVNVPDNALFRDYVELIRQINTGTPPVPVAYLYNGVRLPALPEWANETYPVALIYRSLSLVYTTYFYVAKSIVYKNSNDGIRQVGLEDGLYCHATYDDSVWTKFEEFPVNPYWICDVGSEVLLWTNTDIVNADGTVALEASDPVPVYE